MRRLIFCIFFLDFLGIGLNNEEVVIPHHSELIYPSGTNIVDVTQSPYFADNSGAKDVTEVLIKAATFARNENRILYFPNGTYLVSNTIVYDTIYNWSHYDAPKFYKQNKCEDNAFVRYHGQSKEDVIIKLNDYCGGYEKGLSKPVLSTIRRNWSNIGFNNEVTNITINIGKGNPGAIGLRYNGSNTSSVRNVDIISEDSQGAIGIDLVPTGPTLIKDLTIDGFDVGIQIFGLHPNRVLEHIKLTNQNKYGIINGNTSMSIRNLISINNVPVIKNFDCGHMIVIDSEFKGKNVSDSVPAIINESNPGNCDAVLFTRNIKINGYKNAILDRDTLIQTNFIEEYSSHGTYRLRKGKDETTSLNLPVEETPNIKFEPLEEWVCVDDFGANGKDTLDDTEAFQKALNSGAQVIYAKTGNKYYISNTLEVSENIRRINMLWAQIKIIGNLNHPLKPLFKILDGNFDTIVVQKCHVWHFESNKGKFTFIEHASKKTLIMLDCHIHRGVAYRNTVPGGKVFIENVLGKTRDVNIGQPYSFNFNDVTVFARQINPDGGYHVLNNGGFLWVLGFKNEDLATRFTTANNGITEVLGGITLVSSSHTENNQPVIVNDNSNVSVIMHERRKLKYDHPAAEIIVEENEGVVTDYIKYTMLPKSQEDYNRFGFSLGAYLPLYIGYERNVVDSLLKYKFNLIP